jgi:hypothetical protein
MDERGLSGDWRLRNDRLYLALKSNSSQLGAVSLVAGVRGGNRFEYYVGLTDIPCSHDRRSADG